MDGGAGDGLGGFLLPLELVEDVQDGGREFDVLVVAVVEASPDKG